MNEQVVYKKQNKWYVGKITEWKLRKNRDIPTLSTATDKAEYFTLKQWLKFKKLKDTPESILEKLKVDRLYIKKVEEVLTETTDNKTFDKVWWKKFNDICIMCDKSCKQSSHVIVVECPSRKKKK